MMFVATALATVLLGGGAAATAYSLVDVPEQSTYEISAPTQQGVAHAEVHDPHDVLSAEDEQRMLRDVQQLIIPTEVEQIHYIVFKNNRNKVNDSVEEYLRDNKPEIISAEKYTDGVLIVGVGLDPRQAFVGAGEDVARLLTLHKGDTNLERSLDAIKPGVKDGNIPAGLIAGVRQATDVEKLGQARYDSQVENRTITTAVTGLTTAGGVMLGAGIISVRWKKREKQLAEARENLAFVSKEYGALASRLDGIDIRAHSLTSPLAHHTMRQQWGDVRDRFLKLHDAVDSFGNLSPSSDPELILTQAPKINEAATVARQVGYAEENIDVLFKLEHGDAATRRTQASDLLSDIDEALATVSDSSGGLYMSLTESKQEATALATAPTAPDFLERYARLLEKYQRALVILKNQQLADVKEPATAPTAPAIYDANYRPGYGYADFVPFWALSSWHSTEVAAQEASVSSVNSSYSSGFSGAGGSSSF